MIADVGLMIGMHSERLRKTRVLTELAAAVQMIRELSGARVAKRILVVYCAETRLARNVRHAGPACGSRDVRAAGREIHSGIALRHRALRDRQMRPGLKTGARMNIRAGRAARRNCVLRRSAGDFAHGDGNLRGMSERRSSIDRGRRVERLHGRVLDIRRMKTCARSTCRCGSRRRAATPGV